MELVLNSIVLILLCLTIAYCWKLNSKIQDLKNSRDDIKSLIKNLDLAINGANSSILELKNLTDNTVVEILDYIKQSEELSNDLSFLIEKADKIATQLESNIKASSKISKKTVSRKSSARKTSSKATTKTVKN